VSGTLDCDQNNPVQVIDVFVDELDLAEPEFDGVAREANGGLRIAHWRVIGPTSRCWA
jgi:hypothetical protein